MDEMNRLKEYRLKSGLTQKQLSEKTGISAVQISRIERGDIRIQNVSLKNACLLAEAVGVSAEELLPEGN